MDLILLEAHVQKKINVIVVLGSGESILIRAI